MTVYIQKWGNSHGIRLSKTLIELIGIQEGDRLQVDVRNGKLILTPVRKKIKTKKNLSTLLAEIPPDYEPEEFDWGPPVGKENG